MYLGYIVVGLDKTLCGFARTNEEDLGRCFALLIRVAITAELDHCPGFLKTRGRRLPRHRGMRGLTG